MDCWTGLNMLMQSNPEKARALAVKKAEQGDRSWLDALNRMSAMNTTRKRSAGVDGPCGGSPRSREEPGRMIGPCG